MGSTRHPRSGFNFSLNRARGTLEACGVLTWRLEGGYGPSRRIDVAGELGLLGGLMRRFGLWSLTRRRADRLRAVVWCGLVVAGAVGVRWGWVESNGWYPLRAESIPGPAVLTGFALVGVAAALARRPGLEWAALAGVVGALLVPSFLLVADRREIGALGWAVALPGATPSLVASVVAAGLVLVMLAGTWRRDRVVMRRGRPRDGGSADGPQADRPATSGF